MVNSWKDLTAEQYMRLMDLKDQNEIVEIVYGKPIKDVPLSQINEGALDFLNVDPEKTDIRFFEHKGTKYGFVKFDELSLGEYVDLTTMTSEWKHNIWKIMSILYRPIVGWNLKHKLKYRLGKFVYLVGHFSKSPKLLKKGKNLLMNLDYQIAKYDGNMNNADNFKSMSAIQFHSFVLFFSLLYLRKIEDILKSLEIEKTKKKKKSPSPKKQ